MEIARTYVQTTPPVSAVRGFSLPPHAHHTATPPVVSVSCLPGQPAVAAGIPWPERTQGGAIKRNAAVRYYVYALIDPRDGKPFYIGKGKGFRIEAHEKEAGKGVYSRKCSRIRDIWQAGGQVVRLKLSHHDDEAEAYDAEAEEIERIGLENLTNVLPGGGGVYPTRERRMVPERRDGPLCLTETQLRGLAPRMVKFIRVIEAGERFIVHGFDATDALVAFFRDVVAGTGLERIQSEMRRQGLAA